MLELAATVYVIERVIEWTVVGAVVVVPVLYLGSLYIADQVRDWRHRRLPKMQPAWVADWEADIKRQAKQ
jgi:hypothetical protein